ncbi:uncharacterized protein [Rutidosis leptorrhynchoides]|uniref:uncharacterized protein n=1 Tax=Rutidosis leptorrhynchoides TaxID=125765 RepID=UPI003A99A520
MWQLLLAATIAGSGYFAKQLLYRNDYKPTNDSSKNAQIDDADDKASIFRFSSASNESKILGKKLKGGIKGKNERKLGSDKKLSDDQMKNGRKFAVCLKKRRIGKNASAKCDSSDVKDKSSFGYGVGVGMMYMMSTGKAEIDKLNTTVDETAKMVQELKSEICKMKSLCDSKIERIANVKRSGIKSGQSSFKNGDFVEDHGLLLMSDEGGYASSILTEDPHRDVAEMDQLEAELESELLKLQLSATQTSSCFQNETSTENLAKSHVVLDYESNHCKSVMPSELNQKLCHLLIEQQESQIVDLECELQHTNSKLVEKESELQALKDCVKRLTDFSLTCPTDEEREDQVHESPNKMINGNGRSMVGIKRTIDFE